MSQTLFLNEHGLWLKKISWIDEVEMAGIGTTYMDDKDGAEAKDASSDKQKMSLSEKLERLTEEMLQELGK